MYWLPGINIKVVQEMVENHLQDMILKHFDPKKADSIFTDEGEVCRNDNLFTLTYLDLHLSVIETVVNSHS